MGKEIKPVIVVTDFCLFVLFFSSNFLVPNGLCKVTS